MRPRIAQARHALRVAVAQPSRAMDPRASKARRRAPDGTVWTLIGISRKLCVTDGIGTMFVTRDTWTSWESVYAPAVKS